MSRRSSNSSKVPEKCTLFTYKFGGVHEFRLLVVAIGVFTERLGRNLHGSSKFRNYYDIKWYTFSLDKQLNGWMDESNINEWMDWMD